MAIAVKPAIQVCSVHEVAKRHGPWSHAAFRKVVQCGDTLSVVEEACPHCLSIARESLNFLWRVRYGES
jgi:hypothetical protein